MSHDFIHNLGSIHNAVGYGQKYLQSYASYYADHNVWLDRERNYRPSGRIHLGDNLVPERRLVTSQFTPSGCCRRICITGSARCSSGSTRPPCSSRRPRPPGFDRHDIKRCRLLLPHLQRALRMQHRLSELEVERDAAFDALDHLPWGVAGGQSRPSCGRQPPCPGDPGGRRRSDHSRRGLARGTGRRECPAWSIAEPCGHARRGSGADPGGALSITRPSGAHPLSVMVVPLRTKGEAPGDRAPAAAVFVSDPEVPLDSNQQHLRELYALTVVEARLAAWRKGKSVHEAAAAISSTPPAPT